MRDNKIFIANSKQVLADPLQIARFIDHTLLKPEAQFHDIEKLCSEAVQFNFKAVCVNPTYVSLAKSNLQSSKVLVASVVGFPLGAHLTKTKVFEAKLAVDHGADEIDMVINIGWLRDKKDFEVSQDISAVVACAGTQTKIKVILETSLLNPDEIRRACKLSAESGAHFVKTSTGFSGGGATLENVHTMFDSISEKTEIKASGGIRDLKFACELLAAGATRIGTSSGVQLVQSQASTSTY